MNRLPYSSASERNRQPILDQLLTLLPCEATVLEIGSGSGQHAVFFTRHLSGLCWQPTDRGENISGLEAQFRANGNKHILQPLMLDVLSDPWPEQDYDAVFSANTAHIMPWKAVQAMFAGVAAHLRRGGRFILYGPFNIDGKFTSTSNAHFDASLRQQDPQMGIRDMAEIESLANEYQLQIEGKIQMPANNFILVFLRNQRASEQVCDASA